MQNQIIPTAGQFALFEQVVLSKNARFAETEARTTQLFAAFFEELEEEEFTFE